MATATDTEIVRIGAKLYAEDPGAIDLPAFIPLFHGWIQERSLDAEIEATLARLAAALPRFDGYTRRLQRALVEIDAGQVERLQRTAIEVGNAAQVYLDGGKTAVHRRVQALRETVDVAQIDLTDAAK